MKPIFKSLSSGGKAALVVVRASPVRIQDGEDAPSAISSPGNLGSLVVKSAPVSSNLEEIVFGQHQLERVFGEVTQKPNVCRTFNYDHHS